MSLETWLANGWLTPHEAAYRSRVESFEVTVGDLKTDSRRENPQLRVFLATRM